MSTVGAAPTSFSARRILFLWGATALKSVGGQNEGEVAWCVTNMMAEFARFKREGRCRRPNSAQS